MNSIILTYVCKNSMVSIKKNIPINEYFDLDEVEALTIESSPKFSNPYEYSGFEPKELLYLTLVLIVGNNRRTFKQTFWNNGANILTERLDEGKENYREIILSLKFKGEEYETIRLVCINGVFLPVYHGFFMLDENGNEIEINKTERLFLDILKNRIGL